MRAIGLIEQAIGSYRRGNKPDQVRYSPTKYKIINPPHDLKVYKGMKNVVITRLDKCAVQYFGPHQFGLCSRDFANFTLYDPVALDFYKWLEFVSIPDEYFFQSLNLVNRTEYAKTGRVVQDLGKTDNALLAPRYTLWNGRGKYVSILSRTFFYMFPIGT